MKKIIAFAMSALLAVSSVALPVSAQPAVPVISEVLTGPARAVTAEELAQVRIKAFVSEESFCEGGAVTGTVVAEAQQAMAAVDARAVTGIPLPVSHLDTALAVTMSCSASSACVSPLASRSVLMV